MLTEQQQREFVAVLATGCPAQTAAAAVGASLAELTATLRANREFAVQAARVEALLEVAHMKNIRHTSLHAHNWRASVWWLERRYPEKYARGNPQAVSPEVFRQLLRDVANAVNDEVGDERDRTRLTSRLTTLTPYAWARP